MGAAVHSELTDRRRFQRALIGLARFWGVPLECLLRPIPLHALLNRSPTALPVDPWKELPPHDPDKDYGADPLPRFTAEAQACLDAGVPPYGEL